MKLSEAFSLSFWDLTRPFSDVDDRHECSIKMPGRKNIKETSPVKALTHLKIELVDLQSPPCNFISLSF